LRSAHTVSFASLIGTPSALFDLSEPKLLARSWRQIVDTILSWLAHEGGR
jgi:hypothetical protein